MWVLHCFAVSLLFYSVCPASPLSAAEEFETSYDVTYTVAEDGATTVRQKISLTNLTKEFYASEHELNVGRVEVGNIWAEDPSGFLSPQVLEDGDKKFIRVIFGAPVTGKGKTLLWELGYRTDAAKRLGRIWRIDLPGIERGSEVSSYKLTLKVPKSFGEPAFISPEPAGSGLALGSRWFEFEKSQLERGGVRAGFGDYQAFKLDLKYSLENPLNQKVYLETALPLDVLGRQKIVFERLSPAPEEIYVDGDGNYLARFLLLPKEQKTVEFVGKAFISNGGGKWKVGSGKLKDIPNDLREKYTGPQEFWEVGDGALKAKAQVLTEPEKPVIENVRSIYEYVIAHLSYDAGRAGEGFERLGAVRAFQERDRALCTEYADLFIALARAAGIPTRLIEGYAFTPSKFSVVEDALHAWVEVYLPGERGEGGWHQIDPTWGSTTGGSDYLNQFDFSHITFVRKGLSSTEPCLLAASGGEKREEDWMNVSFSEEADGSEAKLEAEIRISDKEGTDPRISGSVPNGIEGLSGWPRKGVLVVKNLGQTAVFDVKVKFVPKGVGFKGEKELDLEVIPPWSEKKVPFLVSTGVFEEVSGSLEAGISWSDFSEKRTGRVVVAGLKFLPFWRYFFSWWGLLPLGAGLLGFGFWFWRRGF